jgi:HK97 family phage major capsid protein
MKETKQAAPSAETRAALHEVMAAFESFKAANDQRLDELERKGAADPLLEEKVARIDAALGRAERRMERAAADARRPGLGSGGGSILAEPDERKAAFGAYLKTGAAAAGLELKGLSDGVPASGGYLAPAELERQIDRRLAATSPMREIATVRTVGGSSYTKPVSIAGLTANWAAETAGRTETAPPTLDLLSFPAADLYAAPAATQAMLDDAAVNVDEWLAEEVQDAFAGQETQAFVNGDGNAKPKGFLSYTTAPDASQTWGQIGYIATGVAGAFPASSPGDKLLDLLYAPRASFRPNGRFVMNRRTLSAIRKIKDNNGDYILIPPSQAGQTATLFGYPVTEIEAMPDVAANAFAVAFGDFAKGYLIVDRTGTRVLRDPYSAKPYVLFYTLKRVGGGVQNYDAIKLLKFSAS